MSKKNKPIRVKLIANPGAGTPSDLTKNLKSVTEYLKNKVLKVDVSFAKPKAEATPIARRAIKDGYQIVIAMGGDGTLEAVMRGMVGAKAGLGIIPTGIDNNIARSLGIPTDVIEACALITSSEPIQLDLGQVKTSKGKKFVFFEMATVGLAAAIYPDAVKAASGKLSRAKAAALTFFHQETNPTVFLTLNDESKIELETMLVMVSNTPSFGKNITVAPHASLQDGFLDIAVYPGFSKAELLAYYAAVMNGGYSGDKKVQHYQAAKLKVKTSPKLDVMADGVAFGKGKVTIKVLPKALRVFAVLQNPGQESPKDNSVKEHSVPAENNHKESSVIVIE